MRTDIVVEDNQVIVGVNPELYPLEAIYSAAYIFLDKAYMMLDGDLKEKILVTIKPKDRQDLDELGREFLNELINYADYKIRADKTRKIREMMMHRALITNDPSVSEFPGQGEDCEACLEGQDENILDDEEMEDPEGIAVPWEEKYGGDKCVESSEEELDIDSEGDEKVPWEKNGGKKDENKI